MADLTLLPSITEFGSVHAGFLVCGNTFPVAALLKDELLTAQIIVTGHSLGGAVAAARLACQLLSPFFDPYYKLARSRSHVPLPEKPQLSVVEEPQSFTWPGVSKFGPNFGFGQESKILPWKPKASDTDATPKA